jgi:hypothetical protein
MEKKKCFKCNEEKELELFYKHPKMFDKHLNKCIECTKKDVTERTLLLKESDPNWIEKERKRGRDKYYRLNYREKLKPCLNKKEIDKKYANKFPEKMMAKNKSQHIKIREGYNRHHWSYNPEYHKDIIELSISEHNKLHRYMVYDQERMMFRTTKGILLDTKKRHLEYFEQIKNFD